MFSLVSSLLQEELGLTSVGKERDAYWTMSPYLAFGIHIYFILGSDQGSRIFFFFFLKVKLGRKCLALIVYLAFRL